MNEEKKRRPSLRGAGAAVLDMYYGLRNGNTLKDTANTALGVLGHTGAALLLGGAPAAFGVMPFGVALLCAADKYLPAVAVGLCMGALARGQALICPVYILLLFYRLITRLWQEAESERMRLAAAGCAMGLYGVFLSAASPGVGTLIKVLIGIAAGAGFTACASALLHGEARYTHRWESGVFAAVYAASCALADLSIFTLHPAFVIGFIVSVYIARVGGSARGCVAGVLWGLGCGAQYSPAFALAALTAGKASSLLTAVGGGAMVCMIYASFALGFTAVRDFLPDVGIGAALYAPLQKYRVLPGGELFAAGGDDAGTAERTAEHRARLTEERFTAMAQSLGSLSAIFYGMSARMKSSDGYEEREDMTRVFAEDYESVSALITDVLSRAEDTEPDRGMAAKARAALAASGIRVSSISVCGKRQKTLIARGRCTGGAPPPCEILRTRLSNACGTAFSLPEITVDEVGLTLRAHSEPTLSVEAAHAGSSKRGEGVSGDCASSFISPDGYFYYLLCDGMGSGKDAAVAARTSCVFMEKLLEGGGEAGACLKMLNSFLRGKGYECFATVDLCAIDLYTGSAFFIKGGSAPSYLYRGEGRYKIASASVPVGIIREVRAERISFEVKGGDMLVMASDGAQGDELPEDICRRTLPSSAREAAEEILSLGRKRLGGGDDATVCVINVKS